MFVHCILDVFFYVCFGSIFMRLLPIAHWQISCCKFDMCFDEAETFAHRKKHSKKREKCSNDAVSTSSGYAFDDGCDNNICCGEKFIWNAFAVPFGVSFIWLYSVHSFCQLYENWGVCCIVVLRSIGFCYNDVAFATEATLYHKRRT